MGRRSKQTFLQRHIDDQQHRKRHAISQPIRELQIKTIMRYYLTLVRMTIIKKSANNKSWSGCGEKGTLRYCWWECTLVQPLWRTVQFLKKLKIELPHDPAIQPLGIYPENNMVQKDTCTLMFNAVLFTIAKTWK